MALETSGNSASVAVFDDDRLLAAGQTDPQVRTAAGLVPLVRDVLARTPHTLPDVKLISLPIGPGSFTGLRVGVTTAKTLAYAMNCDVLGLDTLEVIAAQAPPEVHRLWAVVDAQRQQLFVRRFAHDLAGDALPWLAQNDAVIVDNATFLSQLAAGDVVSGPGLKRIASSLPAAARLLDESLWQPQAETVGRLAFAKYQAGERGDLWQLLPLYFRPSAAEEKRALQS